MNGAKNGSSRASFVPPPTLSVYKFFEVAQWSVPSESIAHEHPSFDASHRVAGTEMESLGNKKKSLFE